MPKKKIDGGFVPTATYKKAPKTTDKIGAIVDFVLKQAKFDDNGICVQPGRSVEIVGTHGIGKSSAIRHTLAERGIDVVAYSAPQMEITDLYLPLPVIDNDGERELRALIQEKLITGRNFAIIFDDFRRVQASMLSAMMEITNEGSLVGLKLPGLVGVFLVDNPVGEGYVGTIGGDAAFESRFVTFEVTANDIAWRLALANKYPEINLTRVFQVWERLDPALRRACNPRVLDHIIDVVSEGLPAIYGVPILPSGRQKFLTAGGEDRTEQVLRDICSALGVQYVTDIPNKFAAILDVAFRRGFNVHVVGPHGVAKTASLKAAVKDNPVLSRMEYLSMPAASLTDFGQPVPVGGKLGFLVSERLKAKDGRPFGLILDEGFRAQRSVIPQMLELVAARSLGGVQLTDKLRTIIMINNPQEVGDVKYRVGGGVDPALCSRFHISVEITAEDTGWEEFLLGEFAEHEEVVRDFVAWWHENLDDKGRILVPPRTVHQMIELFLSGLPIKNALPFINGERLPVSLNELDARLKKRVVLGFSKIVAEVDDIAARLAARPPEDASPAEAMEHSSQRANIEAAVCRAFQKAYIDDLRRNREVCLTLAPLIATDKLVALVNTDNPDKQGFWTEVIIAAKKPRR